MANKKLKEEDKYGNFHRVLILNLLKQEKMSVTEISKRLEGYPRVAIAHHLQQLFKWGLVKKLSPTKEVGNPIKWEATPRANPVPSKVLEWANNMFKFNKKLKSNNFKVK